MFSNVICLFQVGNQISYFVVSTRGKKQHRAAQHSEDCHIDAMASTSATKQKATGKPIIVVRLGCKQHTVSKSFRLGLVT